MPRLLLPTCLMGAVLAVCACGDTTEDAGAEATGATGGSAGSSGGSEAAGSESGGAETGGDGPSAGSGADSGSGGRDPSGGSGADSGSGGVAAQTSGGSGADSGSGGAGAQTGGGSGAGEAGAGGTGAQAGGTSSGGLAGTIEAGSGGVGESGGAAGSSTGGSGASDPVCSLPPEPGDCLAYMPSFYFDPATSRCEEFVYGGCGGNDNRFPTAAECRAACGGLVPAACSLPPDSGPCDDSIPSYYYDAATGLCEPFSYGGCEGNGNRFETQDECWSACSGATNPDCPLFEPSGACSADGAQCSYDQTGCQCQLPHDSYYCQGVPECTAAGTGGGAGFVPPDPGTGGVAGGGSSDRPAPGVRVCDCTSGSWLCSWAT